LRLEYATPTEQAAFRAEQIEHFQNSLQLDETRGLYFARLLGAAWTPSLINNRHALVSLSTMKAGFRLLLHGLATEIQRALLFSTSAHNCKS